MLPVECRGQIYEMSMVFKLLWMHYDSPNVHVGVLNLCTEYLNTELVLFVIHIEEFLKGL